MRSLPSFWCIVAAFVAAQGAAARAQTNYPNHPIQLVVTVPPGGAAAAASPQRHRLLPDVPSFAELGYPGMDIALWYGIVAPGGTPAPIVLRLNAELAKIVAMPDVRKNLSEQGADLQGGSPEEFAAFMRAESDRWSMVVKQAGIKPE
jgi:tripartite-type tricarboxylate transporter receptor subunit TctC